jgi:hypothetical protein
VSETIRNGHLLASSINNMVEPTRGREATRGRRETRKGYVQETRRLRLNHASSHTNPHDGDTRDRAHPLKYTQARRPEYRKHGTSIKE